VGSWRRSNRNEATIAIALGLSALLSVWLAFGTVPTGALLTLLGSGFGVGVAGPNRDLLVPVSVREARFTIRNVPVAQQQFAFQSR
jgi:hypothetical protein